VTLAVVSAMAPDLIDCTNSVALSRPTFAGSGGSEIPGRLSVPSGRSAAATMMDTPRMVAWSAVASRVSPPVALSWAAVVSTRPWPMQGPCRLSPEMVEEVALSSITFIGPPAVLTDLTVIDCRPPIWMALELSTATAGAGAGRAVRVGTGDGVGLGLGAAAGELGDGLGDGDGVGPTDGDGLGAADGGALGPGETVGLGVTSAGASGELGLGLALGDGSS
jgi:hypothetical protein